MNKEVCGHDGDGTGQDGRIIQYGIQGNIVDSVVGQPGQSVFPVSTRDAGDGRRLVAGRTGIDDTPGGPRGYICIHSPA